MDYLDKNIFNNNIILFEKINIIYSRILSHLVEG